MRSDAQSTIGSAAAGGTVFLDEVATAQSVIDELTAKGYDKIGLVTHQGLNNDLDLASMVDGVDFIVGGDSHTLVGDFDSLGVGDTVELVVDPGEDAAGAHASTVRSIGAGRFVDQPA